MTGLRAARSDARKLRRHFRPIALTAAAAVLALVPLVSEVFWAPMALAMMGGLIAATVLTMTFLPALYALAFGVSPRAGKQPSSAAEVKALASPDLLALPAQPSPPGQIERTPA